MSTNKICDNQDNFNQAFRKAVKYVDKKNTPKLWVQIVAGIIMLLVIIWAVLLARKVDSSDKVLHFLLALVFAPFYIISYYLSS